MVTCAIGATDRFETMTVCFRHMPVVEGEIMGIVTIGDVKARMTELAMEKDALEGMIMY